MEKRYEKDCNGIILFVILVLMGHFGLAILVILFVIIIGYLMFLSGSPLGMWAQTEAGSYSSDVKNMWRQAASPLNTMKMIMTGEYDPSEIWTSKT